MRTIRILALADLHLKENKPECRDVDEDWMETIDRKIQFIRNLAINKKVNDIVIAGDIFDSWRTNSMGFLIQCSKWLKQLNDCCKENTEFNYVGHLRCIPGNHDSMGGSIPELKRSPYTLMAGMGVFKDISKHNALYYPIYYSDNLHDGSANPDKAPIIVMHKGMYYKRKPFDEAKDENNIEWFVETCTNEHTKLVISGDYHTPFTETINNVVCINCGSTFRLRADQIDYKPKATIITFNLDTNAVTGLEEYPIPLEYNIHRDHIDEKKELYQKLSDMLDNVDDTFELSLNFKDNFKHIIANDPLKDKLLLLFEAMYD